MEPAEVELAMETTPSTVLPPLHSKMSLTIEFAVAWNPRIGKLRSIDCVDPAKVELVKETTPSTVLPPLQSEMSLTIEFAVAWNP